MWANKTFSMDVMGYIDLAQRAQRVLQEIEENRVLPGTLLPVQFPVFPSLYQFPPLESLATPETDGWWVFGPPQEQS